MTGCYVLVLLLLTGYCWAGKRCCDPFCSGVISYGTTITRHISKHQDYLSFPRNALVEVYAKIEDPDVWLVKYGNKKGFVPQKMILEKTVNCDELVYVDEKETNEESVNHEQVNDDSMGNHGDQAPSSEPVIVTIPTPVDTPSNGGQYINDMIGEDEKEPSEPPPTISDDTPTGEIQEEDTSEKTFHDDTSGSPTMPPQVDSHDNDKPVEPVEPAKQDGDHYKPQLDDEVEKVFEFNTEEEFHQWSDHMMKDRAHMSNEEIVNEDSEAAYDEEEEVDDNNVEENNMENDEDDRAAEEKEDLENEDVKKEDVNEDEEEDEDEDEEEEEREEEDQKEVQEVDIEQSNKEEEMFEGSSELGHEEDRHTLPHMTSHDETASHDHEQHQQEYSPSDVDTPTDDDDGDDDDDDSDDPKVFEKIAEELATANKQPTEWEELVEKELDDDKTDTIPVTMVTDSSDINPTSTHDHADTVTSVVMATVHEMSDNEDTQGDDSVVEQQIPNIDEKNNEIVNEQLEHLVIDKIQETINSDNGEIHQKYEQDNLNISESSESQKYEQEHYSDSEIPKPEIHENINEELEIQLNISDLEHQTDDVPETEDVRGDDVQLAEHGVEEERKRDEETQQDIDDLVKQKDAQRGEEGKDLEKQDSQQKDEREEEKIEQQKDAEDDEKEEGKHENDDKNVEDEKKEDKEQQSTTSLQEVQQPSIAYHPPSITVVEEESTSTLVAVTTHDVPMPHTTQSVTTSVSMTTDDSEMEGDSREVSEEKTVEVVHKPPSPPTTTSTTTHHDDNQLRDIDSRQSEDVFMSEKHHHIKRSLIVSYLPSFLADMLVDVDDNLVYTILGTMVAILFPCCVMSCRSSIKSSKQRRELENVKAKCRSVDEKVVKLEEEKKQLLIKYNTELGKCQSVEELLSAEKQNMALLQQTNNEVNELLLSTQAQLQQYQSHNDQLVGELTTERQLHATQITATQEAQQELMATRSHLQQASQQVGELEATREQLEQELFTVKQNIDELQATHLKLQQSHDEVTQRSGSLDEQLVSVSSNLETTESLVKEKDDELKLLRECLLQLQSDESDDDKESESNGDRKVLSRKNSKIEKVHAMLDTTKVQTELKSVKEERESLRQQLESKIQTLQQLEDELEQTKSELTKVHGEQDELSLKHAETEIKLNTLTEYFERKEQNLHRKLGVEEAARQEIENREATAKEKVSLAEEERAKEREELQQLRQQMSEIEKSLMQQVVTNEKRAQEALAQLRRTEQELRLANRELNDLKKRLSGSRPTSPGGSETGRIPSHPHAPMLRRQYSPPPERYHEPVPVRRRPPSTGPRMESRPLSAPRFPRTSSPSELEHPPVPGRQLNDTYPGHSRSLAQPHPPRDSYSLDDRDRLMHRGLDEGKGLPPPPLHHHPRSLPPHKSSERMDRPVPMSDRPPLPQSISDHHHSLPPRHMPPGPRGDPNMMMPARRPPLYHPHPGAVRAPPPHDPLLRRPGPPPTTHNRQPPSIDTTEQAKPTDQHKMEV